MAVALEVKLLRDVQPAGISHVAAVDHVDERADAPLGLAQQGHRAQGLAVDAGRLLARAQLGDRGGAFFRGDAIRDAEAGAAEIEPEHEARPLRRAAMHIENTHSARCAPISRAGARSR